MAEIQPFRATRFDATRVDPARTIAPPYDVISPAQQVALYDRSPHNIVRIEYGEQREGDGPAANRYTRAANDLAAWQREEVLLKEAAPALYHYRLSFEWAGRRHERSHYFGVVRLEEWEKGVIKPHEHTLSGPKADRLDLLRATRTQVSPVYCLYRPRTPMASLLPAAGSVLYEVEADGQRHTVTMISDLASQDELQAHFAQCDFYIADGHHRYETALAYREERRAAAAAWTGNEPENFVLMAFTDASDPGLLVLPTHRLVHVPKPADALGSLINMFHVKHIDQATELNSALAELTRASKNGKTAFLTYGLEAGATHLLTLRDREAVERGMPAGETAPWKQLDVNVLQYGILREVFGIDDEALKAGGSVSYIQEPGLAFAAVDERRAACAFLLNATPVDQLLAVSDVNGRMPQKSTYFYPKLPTGLLLNAFD